MTLEVMNLIYLIHKATFKEESLNKTAFTTVYFTWFSYVEYCLKNTYYSCSQKRRHVGDVLLLCFRIRM